MKSNCVVALAFLFISLKNCLAATDSDSFLKTYDKKICTNEPTCNLTDNPSLAPRKLTFEGRDCMCDFECVEYNDCCKDSDYYKAPPLSSSQKSYYCSPSANVYMVTSCSPTYADEAIKSQCAKAILPLEEYNTVLIRPVTNKQKRVTYANAYCALCNDDTDFEPWNILAGCGEAPAGYLSSASASTTSSSGNTPGNKISNAVSSTSAKPDNSVKLQLHFNPGALLGKNKSEDSGFNKEVKIPTFGLGDKINKTIGSSSGLFGLKLGRSKRDTKLSLDFLTYASKLDEILKTVRYDPTVKEFVARYDNKDFICDFKTSLPSESKNFVRKCVPNLISECPGNNEANKLCQSYTAVVYDSEKRAYRNKDCAICNNAKLNPESAGCPVDTRTAASSLFSTNSKAGGSAACSNPDLAAKFC